MGGKTYDSNGRVQWTGCQFSICSRYQGLDHLPATMTLGRRGHYASGGRGGVDGVSGRSATGSRHGVGAGDTETPLLGPNMGQYATLSKQCKTLESSDFY